ncbi:cytochrome D1 domain-containing protein [Sphingomicrobium clamense]|uniref:Beta-propeller fold lactonase family protein n=1 Tax=Sphingomicrobium clamense TaxID=2851013 RepID=A0ABS6V749_9SPHN|nr:cytochrome D1 domain-containing protein [Sphingomicrobium sp. B8]MBW0144893.1 beta-propeller fold lactonase family protein [Sphingomicrobium sp. B8]
MRLPLIASLVAFAAPAEAQTLVVGNKAEHTVSFVDLESGQEVARRETGRAPHEIAVSPDGKTAVLVSYREPGYNGNTLHVFDVATGEKQRVIDLGEHRGPHGLKWIGGTNRVIATTEVTQDVVIADIATGEVVESIDTDMQGTHMVALSPNQKTAYVASIGSNNFSVLDLEAMKKVADVPAGLQSEAIQVSPDGREIWVGSNGDKTVTVYDAHSLEQVAQFETDGVPIRVEPSPDGKHVAVSLANTDKVLIVDAATREEVTTIDLASVEKKTPVTMLWRPDGQQLFVATTQSASVIEIDPSDWSISRIFAVGAGSDGLAYSPLDTATRDGEAG